MSSENSGDTCSPNDLPAEVFLGTSIFLARLKGEDLKKRVDDTLQRFGWKGTCSYVKLEFGNVVLKQVAYYYRKLKDFGSLERLRYHVNNRLIPTLPDHERKRLWFFNLLRDHAGDDTEKAERTLRHLMRVGTSYVSNVCDKVYDEIKCPWADQEVTERRGWYKPAGRKHPEADCRLGEFFREKEPLFCQIRDAIRNLPADKLTYQLGRFADLIEQACQDPRILSDCKLCPALADAIISVESEGYTAFFTQNVKEYSVLCRVLKQLLLYLKQEPEDPVERRDYRSSTAPGAGASVPQ